MKQTLTRTWARLRKSERDALLGAVAGFFLGLVALSGGGLYEAHFLFRAPPKAPQETVLQKPTSTLRQKGAERRQERLKRRQQRNAATPVLKTAMGMTDEPEQLKSLRPAAPQEPAPSAAASQAASSAQSPVPSAQSTIVAQSEPAAEEQPQMSFPALGRTAHPVSMVPNWGAMRGQQQWGRSFGQMTRADFVPVPAYDLDTLTIPLSSLVNPIKEENIPILTAKLYYSTRYLGKYDLDAGERSGSHDGVDLKLAPGTPVGSIGGGRVYAVREDDILGRYVLIEHRASGVYYLSIYGHLDTVAVRAGQEVATGDIVGTVGMTGNTSGPHLHLAVHTSDHQGTWNTYAAQESINPMVFIAAYRNGE